MSMKGLGDIRVLIFYFIGIGRMVNANERIG